MNHSVPAVSSTLTAYTASPAPRTTRGSRAATILPAPGRPSGPVMIGRVGPADPALERESRLSVAAIENDNVAGIDPMGILDLVAIHAPQIGPAPGLLEEFACDTPQRVALLDRVTVRGVVLKLYFLCLQYARRE